MAALPEEQDCALGPAAELRPPRTVPPCCVCSFQAAKAFHDILIRHLPKAWERANDGEAVFGFGFVFLAVSPDRQIGGYIDR